MGIESTITPEKLEKYFKITTEALKMAKESNNKFSDLEDHRKDTIDMVERYVNDAKFFKIEKNDFVNAFAALSYAHGWLDAGARLGIFEVYDSRLFTVDEK